jgi:hypothetical protein
LRHVLAHLRVDMDGDRALARCYLIVFLKRDGESRVLPPGQYRCELVCVDGAWRFHRRVVTHDHEYVLEGL